MPLRSTCLSYKVGQEAALEGRCEKGRKKRTMVICKHPLKDWKKNLSKNSILIF